VSEYIDQLAILLRKDPDERNLNCKYKKIFFKYENLNMGNQKKQNNYRRRKNPEQRNDIVMQTFISKTKIL